MQHKDLNLPLRRFLFIGNELEGSIREQFTHEAFEALHYTLVVQKWWFASTRTASTVLKFELYAALSQKS